MSAPESRIGGTGHPPSPRWEHDPVDMDLGPKLTLNVRHQDSELSRLQWVSTWPGTCLPDRRLSLLPGRCGPGLLGLLGRVSLAPTPPLFIYTLLSMTRGTRHMVVVLRQEVQWAG